MTTPIAAADNLYVVEVGVPSFEIDSYQDKRCGASYFQKNIVENPKMKCHQSSIAKLCGKNVKIYFVNYKPGLAQPYRQGGEDAVSIALATNQSSSQKFNAAAASLTVDIETGLNEYNVCARAYVVEDDGRAPLSKGQVWGLYRMVASAMSVYDMLPENMVKGKRALTTWAKQYKKKKWRPAEGTSGIDIYSYLQDPYEILLVKGK